MISKDDKSAWLSAYCCSRSKTSLRLSLLAMGKRGEFAAVSDGKCRLERISYWYLGSKPFCGWTQKDGWHRTVLKNIQSRFPSAVDILKAKPRVSLTLSADPLSPTTVEKRAKRLVFLPTSLRKLALVRSEILSVTSKTPYAPAPLAWTTLENNRNQRLFLFGPDS